MVVSEPVVVPGARSTGSHQRYVVLAVLFSLSMLTIIDRVAISAAKMDMSRDLGLNDVTFGMIFGAFALGYALFQIPAGILVDRLGARILIASVIGLWSVFTGMTIITRTAAGLVAVRFLFGAAEAGAFPAAAQVIRSWLPARETGISQGILFSGSRLGAAAGLMLTSWSVARLGWRASFVGLSAAGLLWMVGWLLWFRNVPEESRWTSETERAFIRTGREPTRLEEADAVRLSPWSLLRLRETPALLLQYFASNFTFFLCFTWLLPYLRQRYHLSAGEAGLMASMPLYFGTAANWTSGVVVDQLYRRGWERRSRVIPAVVGFLLGAAGLCVAVHAGSAWGAVLAFAVATFGVDLTLSPSWTLCIDVAGARTGTLSGAMNMCGNLGSFASSLAFPLLYRWTGRADAFFYWAAGLNVCAAALWLTMGERRQATRSVCKENFQ